MINHTKHNHQTAMEEALALTDAVWLPTMFQNMFARNNNGEQLIGACDNLNFYYVRNLVTSGASVDYQGGAGGGWTPATICCYRGHSEILQFLLEQGANAELANIADGHSEILQFLLEQGDTELANIAGSRPLHIAAMRNKYECAAVLLRHGVVLDAITKDGCTALWLASREGYLPIVQLLVQGGADIERADSDGETPIVIAREGGHAAVVAYLAIEVNWRRRRSYATVLNSLKGAPTNSKMMRAFQCHDVARLIGSYL
jgi:ankyrin repeat protein